MTLDQSKPNAKVSSRECLSNGEKPRVQLAATTGFVGYKARCHIAKNMNLPIEAVVKNSLYKA